MTEDSQDRDALESWFEAARQVPVRMPDGLIGRIVADAAREQDRMRRPASRPDPAPVRTGWRDLTQLLGGWAGMGGLATACATGVWLGFSPPQILPDPAEVVMGAPDTLDLFGGEAMVLAFAEDF